MSREDPSCRVCTLPPVGTTSSVRIPSRGASACTHTHIHTHTKIALEGAGQTDRATFVALTRAILSASHTLDSLVKSLFRARIGKRWMQLGFDWSKAYAGAMPVSYTRTASALSQWVMHCQHSGIQQSIRSAQRERTERRIISNRITFLSTTSSARCRSILSKIRYPARCVLPLG